jgi:hypothetical protein
MKTVLLLLALAACSPAVVTKPIMSSVDRPAPPRGAAAACRAPAWEPIRLPTDAADQIAARQDDQAAAEAAIAECDRRRSRAVQFLRRLGFDL